MSESAEILSEAFRDVGRRHGYEKVEAEFAQFREFKVQWQRSYKWAAFRVSDYLMDADAAVFEGLAETLFSRITGREETPYDEAMRTFVTAPCFAEEKRPVYLRRSRNLTHTSAGIGRDLADSVQRLRAHQRQRPAGRPGHPRHGGGLRRVLPVPEDRQGQEVFGRGEIFTREEERLFPAYRDAERLLDKLCLFV